MENESERKSRLINRRLIKSNIIWTNCAYNYIHNIKYYNDINLQIGPMNIICQYCQAKRFKDEVKGICCSNGKYELELCTDLPKPLNTLLYSNSDISKIFLKNIRNYNSAFQMTSFGADKIIYNEGYNMSFKVQGQVYHSLGPLDAN